VVGVRVTALMPGGHEPVEFARNAERHGYDGVWTGELWGRDSFVALARVAENVEIDVGTSIVNAYSRSPAALAQAAATLEAATEAGVALGIGPSTRKAIEDLHGASFDNPARRLHETVELASAFLSDADAVDYDGELFSVQDFPGLNADVPIYTAALGPATRRATGRVGDGWLPHNIPFARLDEAFETIAETAREAGRDPDAIDVLPYAPAAVSDDGDEAIDTVRGHLAYYVGSGEGYQNAVASSFPEEAAAVADAWRRGDRGDARGHVTDEMVDALGIAGTPDDAREQLRALHDRPVVDGVMVVTPNNAGPDVAAATVRELAPDRFEGA
jgi:5,10-methylenetetrahydromethanopterin reductase